MGFLPSVFVAAGAMAKAFLAPPALAAATALEPVNPGYTNDRLLRRDPAWVGSIVSATPAQTEPLREDIAAGASGTIIRGGRIYFEEFNPDLENEGSTGDALGREGTFDKMRKTDPQIRRSLWLMKLPILAGHWKVEAGEDTELAREIAEFVSYVIFELNNWQETIRQALLMVDFGHSLLEVVKGQCDVPRARFPNLPHAKGPGRPGATETTKAICWTGIELRHPKTIYQWIQNPDRPAQMKAVVQRIAGSDAEAPGMYTIPAERLMRFTFDQEGSNYRGNSVLRPVVKPWKIREALEIVDAIRHERQNCGTAVMSAPEGAEDADILKYTAILASLGSHERAYLVEKFGYKFRWETSGQGNGTNVRDAIDRCTRDIADNVLAGFMTLGNGDTGSYAMAGVQFDPYTDVIEVLARLIESVVNHGADGKSFIQELVDLNYGPQAKYPHVRITHLKSRDYGKIIELLPKLIVAGALRTDAALRNFLRGEMDLPPEGLADPIEPDDPNDTKEELEADSEKSTDDAAPRSSGSPTASSSSSSSPASPKQAPAVVPPKGNA